jgi:hypothetical protein
MSAEVLDLFCYAANENNLQEKTNGYPRAMDIEEGMEQLLIPALISSCWND